MSDSTRDLGPVSGAAPARPLRRSALLGERWSLIALGAGALVLAFVVRLLLAGRVEAPWIQGDELRYAELARSFSESGDFLFRDAPTDLFTLYGVAIAPAWFADSMSTTYGLVKGINVAMMTAAAVPLFLWARRLMPTSYAAVATGLFLLLPAFVYTGLVMTESMFTLAFVLVAFALALTLERPTILRQALTLGLAAFATGVRTQGVILFAVVASAMLVKALLDLRAAATPVRPRSFAQALRPFAPTLGFLVAVAILYIAYKAVQGQTLSSGLRAYATVAQTDYTIRDAALWVAYHFGEIGLATAVFPACALIALAGIALGARAGLTPAQRAFVAVAVTASVWFVISAGVFASRFSLRIEERNMFYVQPLLILALMAWIALGSPRPRTATLVAAVTPVALVITLPFESLLNGAALGDTFGFVPLIRLSTLVDGGIPEVRVLVALGALAAALLFALVPQRAAVFVFPLVLAAFLALATKSVSGSAHTQSAAARHAYGVGSDPSWVDNAMPPGKKAAFLYSSPINADPHVLWQTEFWNRDVDTVYNYDAPAAGFPGTNINVNSRTGEITPVDAPRIAEEYLVTDAGLDVAGEVVASSGHLVLRRLRQPVRLARAVDGIGADGWMEADGGITGFVPAQRGKLALTLSRVQLGPGAPPATATIVAGPLRYTPSGEHTIGRPTYSRSVRVGARRPVVVNVPVPKPPYRLQLHVAPTFDAAQLGGGDTRQLGAVVGVASSQ